MKELIGLDEIWYKVSSSFEPSQWCSDYMAQDYETLRESASQAGLPAAVADFIAKLDASEDAQDAAPASKSEAAQE